MPATKRVHITHELTGAWETWGYTVPADLPDDQIVSYLSSGEVSGEVIDTGHDSATVTDITIHEAT